MKTISHSLVIMSALAICSLVPLHSFLPDLRAIAKPITSAQQTQINQALKDLDTYYKTQKQLGIQDADVAIGMRKALTMADLLIQPDGALETKICPILKTMFISNKSQEYEINMRAVLDDLTSPDWQEFFAQVKMSQDSQNVGVQVVRALFSLRPDQPVTDRHAKVAVLSALLASYNQAVTGNRFSEGDAFRNRHEYFQHACIDYQSVIETGRVERSVNRKTAYFFFLPVLTDKNRSQSFRVLLSGIVAKTNDSLFDVPAFAAARSFMGGNAIEDLLQHVMQQLSINAQEDRIDVTPTQVIAVMAGIIAHSIGGDADELCAQGEYAFSALTNNTVLRAVEAAFETMAVDGAEESAPDA